MAGRARTSLRTCCDCRSRLRRGLSWAKENASLAFLGVEWSKDVAEQDKTPKDKLRDQLPMCLCPLLCVAAFSAPFMASGASVHEHLVFKLGTLAIVLIFAALYVLCYWLIVPRNDDGVEVALGGKIPGRGDDDHDGSAIYYCGRAFNLPGSDGYCGTHNGPQCASCERYSRSRRHDLAKFYVRELKPKLRVTRWLSPLVCLFLCFVLWAAPETALDCSSDCWGPMIPSLAGYYLPPRNSTAGESWESNLLHVSMFLPILKPRQILPHIGQPIYDRVGRTTYFGAEMGGTLVVTAVILEIARFLCGKWCRRVDSSSNNLRAPLTNKSSWSGLPARGNDLSWNGTFARGTFQSSDRALLWYNAAFVAYYIAYQVSLWVLMDYGVANGLMNLTTGIAWELWVPFVQIVAMTALITGIPWYLRNAGVKLDHPAPKLAMVMAPFLGNEVHIMKDHIAQALCFAAAHCQDDATLRAIGVLLGYLSIVATFSPLLVYFSDRVAFDSLRASHWPIPESHAPGPVPEPNQSGKVAVADRLKFLGVGRVSEKKEESKTVLATYHTPNSSKKGDTEGAFGQVLMLSSKWQEGHKERFTWQKGNLVCLKDHSNTLVFCVATARETYSEDRAYKLLNEFASEVKKHDHETCSQKGLDGRLAPIMRELIEKYSRAEQGCCGCLTQKLSKYMYESNGAAITSVMPDKYMRALVGEVPHTLLHVAFAYFFGGGLFIVVAIVVSVSKILLIPLGRLRLKSLIPKYGCTEGNLQRFLSCCDHLNWGSSDGAIKSARKYRWVDIMACFGEITEDITPRIDFNSEHVKLTRLNDDSDDGDGDDDDSRNNTRYVLDEAARIAQRQAGGQSDELADPYMNILRVLRYQLGVRDKDWGRITIQKVIQGELPRTHLSLLEDIDKMAGQKGSGEYIHGLLETNHDLPKETVVALRATSQQLINMDAGARRRKDRDSATTGVYATMAIHARRVQITVWLLCFALPALAFCCGRHLATEASA